MAAHIYRPLGRRDRSRIEALVAARVRAWVERWFKDVEVSVADVDWWEEPPPPPVAEWHCGASCAERAVGLALQTAQRMQVLALLCGGDSLLLRDTYGDLLPPLADALTDACLRDLCVELVGEVEQEAEPAGRCVAVAVALGTVALRITLSPELAFKDVDVESGGAALTPTASACANQRVAAVVKLNGAELPLAAVASLRVGDVVRLDHRLDEPCRVHWEGGALVLSGSLGRSGAHKAVTIAGRE